MVPRTEEGLRVASFLDDGEKEALSGEIAAVLAAHD